MSQARSAARSSRLQATRPGSYVSLGAAKASQGGLVVNHRKGAVVRSESLAYLLLAFEPRFLAEAYRAAKCAERARPVDSRGA